MVQELSHLTGIRVAFTLIGGSQWTGGHTYLVNLFTALRDHASERIRPVLFAGTDVEPDVIVELANLLPDRVIYSDVFNQSSKRRRLIRSFTVGVDSEALKVFRAHRIDAVFEAASFHGWRFPLPCLAWIPDFQHRQLPHMFSKEAYWKRELGLQAQVRAGRTILLSSEDARRDCRQFLPQAEGRMVVASFAVKSQMTPDAHDPQLLGKYGLPDQFIYFPSQFWKHKNHIRVIDALKLLKEESFPAVVAASGNPRDPRHPEHYEFLQRSVKEYGLSDSFRFLGMIPFPDLLGLMRLCTALINPSLFEGWSTTVEEAKSLGTPLLLSNLRVHVEQAQADAAIFFDPYSPTDIAAAIKRAMNAQNDCDRTEKQREALMATESRISRYADCFVAAVSAAISNFYRNNGRAKAVP